MNYLNNTKNAYKENSIVIEYDKGVKGKYSFKTIRFRYITYLERKVFRKLLNKLNFKNIKLIIDAPCGTGKLSSIVADFNTDILLLDISNNMLKFALKEYEKYPFLNINFMIHDLEENIILNNNYKNSEVVFLCLRLMHRVPKVIRLKMLYNIANISQHLIISYGYDSIFQKLRRYLRNKLFNLNQLELNLITIPEIEDELIKIGYKIEKKVYLNKIFSEQVVFLCSIKKNN